MRHSLKTKMILSYLAVALITVLVVSLLIHLTSGRSLMNLVVGEQVSSLNQLVQDYYTANNSLEGFGSYFEEANHQPPPSQGNVNPSGNHDIEARGIQGLVDVNCTAILPTLGYKPGQTVPESFIKSATEVQVDGETVAWILPDTTLQFQLSPQEELFLQRTNLAIGIAALAGVLIAVTMGFLLANGLLKPIRNLTKASQELVQGNLGKAVPVTSKDELGLLTQTFNQMSADLDKADQQRKRLTADITHDLSTPLQILSGYLEMLEQGEVALTPQRIETIKTELDHLRRLVGDLTMLTQVEAGALDFQIESVQPEALLERVRRAFQPITEQKGITLKVNSSDTVWEILADEGRLEQVLKNLVENALRYTPKGGSIELSAVMSDIVQSDKIQPAKVHIKVKDSGAGIDAEDLPYVFDRFYKGDKSRGGNFGKMGLGLAICKALVNAQGGSIAAESEGKGLGTTIVISLPAVSPSDKESTPR